MTNDMTRTRRSALGGLAGLATIAAAPVYSKTFGLLRGAGDVRKVNMHSRRTGESINTIYWIEGKYIKEVMKEVNFFMRDWREDAAVRMDQRNVDIIAASHRLLETTEPFMLLSGYRTPRTNNMLRSRSRGVAKKSLHMEGMAADLTLKSRSVGQIAKAGSAISSGGVGRYSRSNFVHFDCGPVRSWGR
jgi:uncharacterized protein YcbK (DUF882 family)